MRVAIYDLDRTITRRPTFTPFLVFAARRSAPWRLLLTPVWLGAMIGYRCGLFSRTALKRFGMRLMTGRSTLPTLDRIGAEFTRRRIAENGLQPDIIAMIDEDRKSGARLVVATAAFDFYARHFARAVGIDDVVATSWDGSDIPGGNCYGASKRDRVVEWLSDKGIDTRTARIRMVSDSLADGPMFDIAHEKLLVTASRRTADKARLMGWEIIPAVR